MFIANGKRKFVPRDQVFPFLVFNYSLLLQKKVVVSQFFAFIRIELFLSAHFLFWEIST